jgi:citronellyl-CoA synthetase
MRGKMSTHKAAKTTSNQKPLREVGFFEFFFGFIKFMFATFPLLIRYKSKFTFDATPRKDSIGWYLERNAVQYAGRPALIFEEKTWSFKEFNEAVNRLANQLISLGIKKGDVFVVFMTNRPEMLFCLGAAAKMGAIASMINFNLRGKALHHCVTISPFKAVIVGEELVDAFEEIKADLPNVENTLFFIMADTDENPILDG